MSNSTESALWTFLHSRLLGGQRIRAMAIILVFCLWSVCLVDYAKPGIFDRAGNIGSDETKEEVIVDLKVPRVINIGVEGSK